MMTNSFSTQRSNNKRCTICTHNTLEQKIIENSHSQNFEVESQAWGARVFVCWCKQRAEESTKRKSTNNRNKNGEISSSEL